MPVPFPGFCGPSYQLTNKYAAIERCINWYPVVNESSEDSTSKMSLEPSPANAAFSVLPVPAPFNQPNRGLLENRGLVVGVNGNIAFTINAQGVYTNLGTVQSDGKPCSIVANGNAQVFIASAGHGYVVPSTPPAPPAGSLISLDMTGGFLGASYATFQDGYIIVITPNSNQFQISGTDAVPLGDATQWDAANVSIQAGQADKLRACISSREYLHLMGSRRSQVYYDIGANGIGGFPFQSFDETFIETGINAPFSLVEMGDSLMWIGESSRGIRAAWRMSNFVPQRVSNFAVEQFWQSYATITDAVAFPFIWNGHQFYQITFPSAFPNNPPSFPLGAPTSYTSATWVYDATASQLVGKPVWHERTFQNAQNFTIGRPELFHCYAFGKHLVGSTGTDGNPGAIYQYSSNQFTDCGTDITGAQKQNPLVPKRILPHITSNRNRIIVNRLRIDLQQGVGLDGGAQGADPYIYLRISRDGGNTYGPERNARIGKIGEYSTVTHFDRLGYGRDTVYQIYGGDPVPYRLVAGYLDLFECAS